MAEYHVCGGRGCGILFPAGSKGEYVRIEDGVAIIRCPDHASSGRKTYYARRKRRLGHSLG